MDQFFEDDFFCTVSNIVQLLHPKHHIGRFEFFGYIFFFVKVFYQSEKKLLGLFFGIGKVGTKFAGSEQIVIQNFTVVL